MTWTSKDYEAVEDIFFPDLQAKKQHIISSGIKFAYYTSADVATSILENKRIWMRNTQTMNDPSEIMYGMHLLSKLQQHPVWLQFESTLESIRPGQAKQSIFIFDAWASAIKHSTFITCISEHDPSEDQHGRLSMWRAYGGRNGVALLFKASAMSLDNEHLAVQAMPVSYSDETEFINNFTAIVDRLEKYKAKHEIDNNVFATLVARFLGLMLLCTKHPGFHEEREWRVIAQPIERVTDFLEKKIEIIRGTPQTVFKMILEEQPRKGIKGINLYEILDKVIIGPCDFPEISRDALLEIMGQAGIQKKDGKIIISGIPLRHF